MCAVTSTTPASADITAELSAEELRLIEWIETQAKERGNAVITVAGDESAMVDKVRHPH